MSRIHIKIGQVEIEYEGEDAFIKENLVDYFDKLTKIVSSSSLFAPPQGREGLNQGSDQIEKGLSDWSVSTFATKLHCKSGPDLVLAAAAKLTFTDGIPSFSRQQLTDTMKGATGYFKSSYVNNLSKYIERLIKNDKLRKLADDRFSLSAKEKGNLETSLA